MMTVDEFIVQSKKKDRLDEFNFQNHADNMSKVIRYVTEYFNEYLDPLAYNHEKVKLQTSIEKVRLNLGSTYPKSIDFVLEHYEKTKQRMDKKIEKTLTASQDSDLFYSDTDFEKVAAFALESLGIVNLEPSLLDSAIVLVQEVKEHITDKPHLSEMKQLNNKIVDWVKTTYRQYGVNLYEFAYNTAYAYT